MISKTNQYVAIGLRLPPPGPMIDLDRAQPVRGANDAPSAVTCGENGGLLSDPEWMYVPGMRVEGEIDATGFSDGAVIALVPQPPLPKQPSSVV